MSTLSLNVNTTRLLQTFLNSISCQTPVLETIELVSAAVDLRADTQCITFNSLKRLSPNLRSISPCNAFLEWKPLTSPVNSLTHLDVTINASLSFGDIQVFDVRNTIKVLRSTPALRTLKLRNAFPSRIDVTRANDDATAELPHLIDLYLDGPTPQCLYFLGHVIIPSESRVTFHLRSSPTGAASEIGSLIQKTLSRFHEKSQRPARSGALGWYFGDDELHLLVHSTPGHPFPRCFPNATSHDIRTDVNISFCKRILTDGLEDILHAVGTVLSPSFIHTPDRVHQRGSMALLCYALPRSEKRNLRRYENCSPALCCPPVTRSIISRVEVSQALFNSESPSISRQRITVVYPPRARTARQAAPTSHTGILRF
ncbi:hypothetical protein BC834DRAFT_608981 [Gloeopeniophorella convolvens]|nr:hypothetical protein BC834DRAFT_608981 [Gloeopeniophorella convolvens]